MNLALLIVGIAAGFFHSLYSSFSKVVLNKDKVPPFLFLLYANILMAFLSPLIWLWQAPIFPSEASWIPLLLAASSSTVAFAFLYLSLSSGDVSSVMPLMGSKILFTTLMAGWMLGEKHTASVYAALSLVVFSIGLLGYSPSKNRAKRFPFAPVLLMLACCFSFSVTDVYIRKSMVYMDFFNFTIYYNVLIAFFTLPVLPFLIGKKIPLKISRKDFSLISISAFFLLASTTAMCLSFHLADGVVIPNILMSTRGIFVILISLFFSWKGLRGLDTQSSKVYVIRLIASCLIIISVWLAMK